MDRANEAVSKEHKIAAVAELQNRVEDWKGHKIDHFGDLLLWGNYTVLKGEGAKEVEREVSTIYDSLDPGTRALVLGTIKWSQCRKARIYLPEAEQIGGSPTQCTVSPMVPQGTGNPRGLLAKSAEVWPEAAPVKHETPEVPQTPLKDPPRNTFRKLLYKSPSVDSLTSPDTPSSARKNQILGMFGASGLITPSPKSEAMLFKRSKLESDTSHLCLYEPEALETTHGSSRLHYFNEVFKKNNLFLYSHDDLPTRLVIRFHSQSDVVSVPDIVPVVPTRLEEEVANDTAIGSPVRVQYKVYLFERILLCCKEINPNKPKNKMLSTNKPLVDKKGKPKLQLKGRIFMQNVTDVLTVKRTGEWVVHRFERRNC